MNRTLVSTPSASGPNFRDRVRALVQAEVAKAQPADTARRSLELIVESSIRPRDENGDLAIAVLDETGNPRMKTVDGTSIPFSLSDLVDELRHKHPTLFRTKAASEPAPAALTNQAIPAPTVAEVAAPPTPARPRDWLDLGGNPTAQAQTTGEVAREPSRLRSSAMAGLAATRPLVSGTLDRMRERLVSRRKREPRIEEPADTPVLPDVAPPRRGWRPGIATVAGLGTLLVAGAFLLPRLASTANEQQAAGPASSQSAAQAARDPTTTGSVVAPAAGKLTGLPEVLDTSTLRIQDRVVRLFGVEWARGGGDPDDLVKYLRGREVGCDPAGAADTYRCQVDGQDLSRVVLFNGGGRATPEATPDLRTAEEHARTNKLGVWREMRQPSPPAPQ